MSERSRLFVFRFASQVWLRRRIELEPVDIEGCDLWWGFVLVHDGCCEFLACLRFRRGDLIFWLFVFVEVDVMRVGFSLVQSVGWVWLCGGALLSFGGRRADAFLVGPAERIWGQAFVVRVSLEFLLFGRRLRFLFEGFACVREGVVVRPVVRRRRCGVLVLEAFEVVGVEWKVFAFQLFVLVLR